MKIIKENFAGTDALVLGYAEEQDTPTLAGLEAECFPEDPWSEGMFADALKNDSCKIYILHDRHLSKSIAYGVMYLALDEGDLANIAVLPSRRGEGLGGALLDEMLENSRADGAVRIFLEVRRSNTAARELYLSRDFKEIGIRRNYYRNPKEDAHIMLKEL